MTCAAHQMQELTSTAKAESLKGFRQTAPVSSHQAGAASSVRNGSCQLGRKGDEGLCSHCARPPGCVRAHAGELTNVLLSLAQMKPSSQSLAVFLMGVTTSFPVAMSCRGTDGFGTRGSGVQGAAGAHHTLAGKQDSGGQLLVEHAATVSLLQPCVRRALHEDGRSLMRAPAAIARPHLDVQGAPLAAVGVL